MWLHSAVLDNGLKVLVQDLPGQRTVTALLMFNRGAKDEEVSENGISHYVEHVAFNTSHHTGELKRLAQQLLTRGAQQNADTTKEFTTYYMTVMEEQLPAAIRMLGLLLQEFSALPQVVENERQVILRELSMHHHSAKRIFDLFAECLWGTYTLGLPVIGREETVRRITAEQLSAVVERDYTADNAVLVVLGKCDHRRVYDLADQAFSRWRPSGQRKGEYLVSQTPSILVHHEPGAQNALLCIGAPGVPHGHLSASALDLLNSILAAPGEGRLFRILREERGLVYQLTGLSTHYRHAGAFGMVTNCATRDVKTVIRLIVQEFDRVRRYGVTEEELESAKARLALERYLEAENVMSLAKRLASAALFGETYTVQDLNRQMQATSPQEVQSAASEYLKRRAVSVAGVGTMEEEEIAALI
ncbi:MAG TPA: pitrilysin family protein [Symbiobacteriaceae bacterium]|nr:pitrilysin family protein [Symbiobacteriaceae bacterium]